MQERFEFRLLERYARELLPPEIGRSSGAGTIRIVEFEASDPLLNELARLKKRLNQESNESPFYGWRLKRRCEDEDLDGAWLFQLTDVAVFEPAGMDCGTDYDTSEACPICGLGRRQIGPLRLDTRYAPVELDLARTIGGEMIASTAFAEAFERGGLTGASFGPVEGPGSAPDLRWRQLFVGAAFDISARTRVGISPVEDDETGRYVCPKGHVRGLNQLSELWIEGFPSGLDIASARQAFGMKEGLLYPEPAIVVSHRFREWAAGAKHRGIELGAVHKG